MKFQTKCCVVCVLFLKQIVSKDDVFLALQLQIMNGNLKSCTMMYRMATPNGIDFFQKSNCSHLLLLVKTVCGIELC